MNKSIELITALSDLGAGISGAGRGVETLLHLAEKDRNLWNVPVSSCSYPSSGGFSSTFAKNIENILQVCEQLSDQVNKTIQNNHLPVVLSGDHSCAAGSIAGIKSAKPDSNLGVIWIDAHADLHSPYTTPSGNIHGMPLAASLDLDNLENASQLIDSATLGFWERFKKIGSIHPKISPGNLVYVTLRDFEPAEEKLIQRLGIKVITTGHIRKRGLSYTVGQIFDSLKHCSDLYVSFDTDSLEGSISKGTGIPVNGGLLPSEAEWLVYFLLKSPKITCFEITEFNPSFDFNYQTTSTIFRIFQHAMAALRKVKFTDTVFV